MTGGGPRRLTVLRALLVVVAALVVLSALAGLGLEIRRQGLEQQRTDEVTSRTRLQAGHDAIGLVRDVTARWLATGDATLAPEATAARDRARAELQQLATTESGLPGTPGQLRNAATAFTDWEARFAADLERRARSGQVPVTGLQSGFVLLDAAQGFIDERLRADRAASQATVESLALVTAGAIVAVAATLLASVLLALTLIIYDQQVVRRAQELAENVGELAEGRIGLRMAPGGWFNPARAFNSLATNLDRLRAENDAAVGELQRQLSSTESERALSSVVLDTVPEAIIVLATDGSVIRTNRRVPELLGLSFQGMPRLDRYREHWGRLFGDATELLGVSLPTGEQRSQVLITSLVQRWPVQRELDLASAPLQTASRQDVGRLLVFRDVTAEREVIRVKTEFFSMVTHELRTPLTSINGYVDLLLDPEMAAVVSGKQNEFLATIKSSGQRMLALTNDLLDLSALESGKVNLNRTPFDVSALITTTCRSFIPLCAARQQTLALELQPGLPELFADPVRITQVLTNLVSNAVKYTPDGGRITVKAWSGAGGITIAIIDTGIGMTADEQARLFTSFYRVKNERTLSIPGTGLGLTITRMLVDMHSGSMAVESTPGQGSTFSFTVPLAPAG